MSSVRPKIPAEAEKHLTAWETVSGAVVYADGKGGWTRDILAAAIYSGAAAEAALAAADERVVTDPYLMEAAPGGGVAGRETLRELIRAEGPTVHPQFRHRPASEDKGERT